MTVVTTKSLSFLLKIDKPLITPVSILISFDFSQILSNEPIVRSAPSWFGSAT